MYNLQLDSYFRLGVRTDHCTLRTPGYVRQAGMQQLLLHEAEHLTVPIPRFYGFIMSTEICIHSGRKGLQLAHHAALNIQSTRATWSAQNMLWLYLLTTISFKTCQLAEQTENIWLGRAKGSVTVCNFLFKDFQ